MVTCFWANFAGPLVQVQKFSLAWGAQAVIWKFQPRNAPRGAGSVTYFGAQFSLGKHISRLRRTTNDLGDTAPKSPPRCRAKSTDREQTEGEPTVSFHNSDFVAVISSQSEGLGKMALGIVKIYSRSPFSANRRFLQSVCSRSVYSGQLSWTPSAPGLNSNINA